MALPSPHPDFGRFFNAAKGGGIFTAWAGNGFRFSVPKWMSEPYRLTGLGSGIWGGRWNVMGIMTANYFSLDPQTALAEVYAEAARNGWQPKDLKPQTVMAASISLQQIVDLRSPNVLQAFGVSDVDLLRCPWATEQTAGREALTQAVARSVFEVMAEGLLAPSAQHQNGVNLVIFPSNLKSGSSVQTLHASQIPFVHGLP